MGESALRGLCFLDWRPWRWTRPGKWFGNRSGGLLVKPLLPPLGTTFACQLWPLSVSPQGVFSNVSHALDLEWRPEHPSQFLEFHQIERVSVDEKKVRVNGRYFCRAVSEPVSRRVADLLRTLMPLPESQRKK